MAAQILNQVLYLYVHTYVRTWSELKPVEGIEIGFGLHGYRVDGIKYKYG